MTDEDTINLPIEIIDQNDDETVGLARNTGIDLSDYQRVSVDPDLLVEFAEKCQQMDWDEITMYHTDEMPVFAHERGDEDSGVFAVLAPIVRDSKKDGETDE